ncbi:unnamed protein product [Rodentolepis nana]|uniref:Uncharacterized protein n=1 Tax=Rodentolepis nana TaxID=102285 RepID=A0A0R3T5R1_RODNA|nr:unnamed protein product [Rodentolepis nana]
MPLFKSPPDDEERSIGITFSYLVRPSVELTLSSRRWLAGRWTRHWVEGKYSKAYVYLHAPPSGPVLVPSSGQGGLFFLLFTILVLLGPGFHFY